MSSLPLPSHPPVPALRVDYRRAPLAELLATPQTLAVFGFGDDAPAASDDPRYLHVALPAATTPEQQQAYRALAQAFPQFQPRSTHAAPGTQGA